jgi:hypothetical protein
MSTLILSRLIHHKEKKGRKGRRKGREGQVTQMYATRQISKILDNFPNLQRHTVEIAYVYMSKREIHQPYHHIQHRTSSLYAFLNVRMTTHRQRNTCPLQSVVKLLLAPQVEPENRWSFGIPRMSETQKTVETGPKGVYSVQMKACF